jgi:N-methylhydantoinase B
VRVRTPGGGGYGRPEDRDPAAVLEDVRLGRYDEATARRLWPQAFALADAEKGSNSA